MPPLNHNYYLTVYNHCSKFVDVVTLVQVTTFSGSTLDAVTGLPIGNVTIQINNSSASNDGWYIDDVTLTAAGQICHSNNPDVLFKNSFE